MTTIHVDGVEFEVKEGENLLQAILSNKGDLPYFCWHPSLGSVGACRQCAVIQYQDADDQRGRLIMACMTPVAEGMRVSVAADQAADFRSSVIEWLMENHPHDCPVCEEGGECHLQDMTVMTGHTSRRYRGKKRTFENQYLGPFLNHEMNRCITCYRCVRFYRDYAGGTDLQAFGSRSRMYFGRAEDGVLESPFSGNLVEVCPTGVFTDKPFSKDYTRKWDLQSAPSVCSHCSIGCNTMVGERYGRIKRTHNRYNSELNGYFLCDKGRYGFGFVNEDSRLTQAGIKVSEGEFDPISSDDATKILADSAFEKGTVGIGSPRASLEANFALRALVGEENFCSGLSSAEEKLTRLIIEIKSKGGALNANLSDVEEADAVLVLGEDILNTGPRVALAVRQSTRNEALNKADEAGIPLFQEAGVIGHAQGSRSPLFIANPTSTDLDEVATNSYHADPEAIAAMGYQIANNLDSNYASANEEYVQERFVLELVSVLRNAKKPLIISGSSLRNPDLIKAAANIAWALGDQGTKAGLLFVSAEANTMGSAMFQTGMDLDSALAKAGDGAPLVILENDIYRRADKKLVDDALEAAQVTVLDCVETPTVERASIVIPTAAFTESLGTYVNFEGRAQRYYNAFSPDSPIKPAWEWFSEAAKISKHSDAYWEDFGELIESLAKLEGFAKIKDVSPGASYRNVAGNKVPRATHRYSGRTAMNAAVNIHEPKTGEDVDTPFSYSMEGAIGDQPASLTSYVWSPGWNSNQSLFKFQDEIAGPINGDDLGALLLANSEAKDLYTCYREIESSKPAHLPGHFRLIPAYRIFGSEELSASSPAIKERAAPEFLSISPDDAVQLSVSDGDGLRCELLDKSFSVVVDRALPVGLVAMGMGLGGLGNELPLEIVSLTKDTGYQAPGAARSTDRIIAKDR